MRRDLYLRELAHVLGGLVSLHCPRKTTPYQWSIAVIDYAESMIRVMFSTARRM